MYTYSFPNTMSGFCQINTEIYFDWLYIFQLNDLSDDFFSVLDSIGVTG